MENTKHQVHNLIILDESGSMASIKGYIIQGFNELVQSVKSIQGQFPDQEHFITMISFNSWGNKLLHFMDPVERLQAINAESYQPSNMTPLYDAIGFGIQKLQHALTGVGKRNVLVTIMTDGEENASKEFSGAAIKALVEALKPQGWTFTYIGTDHDVQKAADRMSISNTMAFRKDPSGVKEMFEREKRSRAVYSVSIREKFEAIEKLYEEEEAQERAKQANEDKDKA